MLKYIPKNNFKIPVIKLFEIKINFLALPKNNIKLK